MGDRGDPYGPCVGGANARPLWVCVTTLASKPRPRVSEKTLSLTAGKTRIKTQALSTIAGNSHRHRGRVCN